MDKDYIQRLKDMLADANKKLAEAENIQDPTERDMKKSMFLNSKKEIESLLKKEMDKKPETVKPVEKKASKPAPKKEEKKPEPKKISKPQPKKAKVEPRKSTKRVSEPLHKKSTFKKVEPKEAPKKETAPKVKTEPVVKPVKQSADEKSNLKQLRKEADLKAKQRAKISKQEEKEYKKNLKLAKKEFKKPKHDLPEYSDEVSRIRSIGNIPAFGYKPEGNVQKDLALNTMYASVFEILPEVEQDKHEHIVVKPYVDEVSDFVIKEYKDDKQTPTAKIGVEAGPLSNGHVPVDGPEEKSSHRGLFKKKVDKKPEEVTKESPKEEKQPEPKMETKVEQPKPEAEPAAEKQPELTAKQKAKMQKAELKAKAKEEKLKAKENKRLEREAQQLAKEQEREALERETEMKRKQEEDVLRQAKAKADKSAAEHEAEVAKQKAKEAEINKLAEEASAKAAAQEKEDLKKSEEDIKKADKAEQKEAVEANKATEDKMSSDEEKRIAEQSAKRAEIKKGEFIKVELPPIPDEGVKSLKAIAKRQKQLTSKYSKQILDGAIVTTTDYKPDVTKHVIELHDVVKSYITGDVETPVLKGVNLTLNKGDFIVILGPSGSGKTTFLNTISGLDKATKGDVFVLGYNLSYLKDSHLTKFRRKHVGFIFQQYNLLTNLTAKENAEVGENLATNKNADMTIEDIFETIGMKTQMNKYPHQMSGGQQQRVSIARALAKNPDILFADEPTGALDEEMGRKVLEILVEVNKRYGTTVIVVTHNPNIAKIGNTVIHIRNGRVDEVEKNQKPEDPATIEWA